MMDVTNQAWRQVLNGVGLTMKERIHPLWVSQCPQMSCGQRQCSDTHTCIHTQPLQYKVTHTLCTLPASRRWPLTLSLDVCKKKSSKARFTSGLVRASRLSVSWQLDRPIRLQKRIKIYFNLSSIGELIRFLLTPQLERLWKWTILTLRLFQKENNWNYQLPHLWYKPAEGLKKSQHK